MEVPPPPPELFPYIHWDVSPLRPWEWRQADAEDWTEAQAVHGAIEEGKQDAHDEYQANLDLARDVKAVQG